MSLLRRLGKHGGCQLLVGRLFLGWYAEDDGEVAVDIEKAGSELGGTRKLIQDLLAPELGAIKATLSAFQESTRENFALLHDAVKASETRTLLALNLLRDESKAQEQRTLRAIESSATELKLLIRATDAERRRDESERRNADLERQLAEARAHPPAPQQ